MTGISVSAYYYKPKVSAEEKARRDTELRDKIEKVQAEFSGYGYRRIKKHFDMRGEKINDKRIRRIMKEHGLMPEIKRAYKVTTDSDHDHLIYPNVIKGMVPSGTDQIWVGDITYIKIATCFVYLAVILDMFSRKVIGWAISKSLHKSLSLEALKMAIEERKPNAGCIHHTDRGVQYACEEYTKLLLTNNFIISMSDKGNPYHNAFAESFMKTLKYEEVYLNDYETYIDVIERVSYFIEEVYNKKRLHSGIGYLSPNEFERQHQLNIACKSPLNSEEKHSS